MLSLPPALPGFGAAHCCPQAQDGQQQQLPGSRTPEHLEWMGGEPPSPGCKWPRMWFFSQPAGQSPEVRTPVRRWETEDGKRVGEEQKLWPQVSFTPRDPSPPLVQLSGCGQLSPKSRGLYGTVPSRPPTRPCGLGRRDRPDSPHPSCRRSRRRPRSDWPGIRVTSRGTVGSPRTKEMLISRQVWG